MNPLRKDYGGMRRFSALLLASCLFASLPACGTGESKVIAVFC